jgi:RNA polymerase sigma factor (sigma-70 family)
VWTKKRPGNLAAVPSRPDGLADRKDQELARPPGRHGRGGMREGQGSRATGSGPGAWLAGLAPRGRFVKPGQARCPAPPGQLPLPAGGAAAFEDLFRSAYPSLLRDAIFAGGNPQEAEDAVSAALAEVFQRWDAIGNPWAYARRATISILIKNKQRGQQRLRDRLVQRGEVPPEHDLDPGLAVWEQQEWVMQLLESLPPAQREVLACVMDMFTRQEIAQLLGKTEAAVRQNLHAARKSLISYLARGGSGPAPHGEEAR